VSSNDTLVDDLKALFNNKYEDKYFLDEFLNKAAETATLMRESIVIKRTEFVQIFMESSKKMIMVMSSEKVVFFTKQQG
jgi:hypothetical protein